MVTRVCRLARVRDQKGLLWSAKEHHTLVYQGLKELVMDQRTFTRDLIKDRRS